MRTIETTAGMNWISDAGHYLITQADRDGEASVRIVRTWDYKRSQPFPVDARPSDVITCRKHGNGRRYTLNGRHFAGSTFVRVIAELDVR